MTARFSNLIVEFLGENRWRVNVDFTYADGQTAIVVPAGFETDFASIPQVFHSILSPTGAYGKAAVIHDFLYATKFGKDRKLCDAIFLRAMKALRVGWFKRTLIHGAVRRWGWIVWNRRKVAWKPATALRP